VTRSTWRCSIQREGRSAMRCQIHSSACCEQPQRGLMSREHACCPLLLSLPGVACLLEVLELTPSAGARFPGWGCAPA
jgi:hypothetical protein